jgi:pimeloyl-ACP methyl ester carboxylesterase
MKHPNGSKKQEPASAMTSAIKAPPAWMMLLEGRAPWELAATFAAWPWLSRLPRGDGHPVLVFPGLAANDLSTIPLRSFLRALNYDPYPWNYGLNFGPRTGVLKGCIEHVKELSAQRKMSVSLVGWSLGGIYAREVAKQIPGKVRMVITLGTPFDGPADATNAGRLFKVLSGIDPKAHPDRDRIRQLPPVPTTSILSKTDGVVAWQTSVNPHSAKSETIEITASHMGMGANPLSFYAIADRLAQPEGQWRAFQNDGFRRPFFKTGHQTEHADSK